jgi:ribose-phosphate pyrophosphokinase
MTGPLVFSIPSYEDLAGRLIARAGWEPGQVERRRFTDGETYQRVVSRVEGRDVVLVAGTATDADTLLAYDLACGLTRYGARRFTWLVPYMGYQTMERATKPGEVVTAKTRARLMSSVPRAAQGNRVAFFDLHAHGIPHYLEGDVYAVHLYGKRLVFEAVRELTAGEPYVLAAPDAGRAKWVESLAGELGVEVALAYKRRLGDGETRLTGVDARVQGKVVVIYDDMIRTGGTLLQAARAYREAGAIRCYAVTTHLVLPGDALQRLLGSGLIDAVAGTDSHPRARELEGTDGLSVRSVAPVFADWLLDSEGSSFPD